MSHRSFATFLVLAISMSFVSVPVAGQGTAPREVWTPAQTPWGDPDLQGT